MADAPELPLRCEARLFCAWVSNRPIPAFANNTNALYAAAWWARYTARDEAIAKAVALSKARSNRVNNAARGSRGVADRRSSWVSGVRATHEEALSSWATTEGVEAMESRVSRAKLVIAPTDPGQKVSVSPCARDRELLGVPRSKRSSDIMMRPTPRSDSSKVWLPVNARDLGSMKEGQTLLKTLEGGMWKWHVTQPGDGRTRSNFQCNGHEDCKRELRVVKVNDVYMIQGRGSHGVIPKERKRANSTLTVQQEKLVRFALDQGGEEAAGLLPEVFGEGKYGTSGVNSRGGKQKYKGEECVWKRVSKDGKHYRIFQHSTGYFYQKGFLPSDTGLLRSVAGTTTARSTRTGWQASTRSTRP